MIRLVREAAHGLFSGGYVGAVIGAAEAVLVLGDPSVPATVDLLLSGALFYAAVGGVIGLVAGIISSCIDIPPFDQPGSGIGMAIFVTTGGLLFLMFRPNPFGGFPPTIDKVQDALCGILAALATLFALIAAGNAAVGKRVWASWWSLTVVLLGIAALTATTKFFERAADAPAPAKELKISQELPDRLRDKPNTLFIVVDSLRRDRVPAYNKAAGDLPGFRKLQKDGVTFTQAVAASSEAAPAIASLLTGMIPSRHGVRASGDKLDKNVRTLFEVQQKAKIATAAVFNHPALDAKKGFKQGFDHFVLDRGSSKVPSIRTSDLSALRLYRFLSKVFSALQGGNGGQKKGSGGGKAPKEQPGERYRSAEEVFTEARRFVSKAGKARWSMILHVMEPHAPYQAHPLDGGLTSFADLTPAQRYTREVAHVDRALSSFIGWLVDNGVYDNTLIVLTADHGEELGERDVFGHGNALFDEVVLVPLIMKFPGSVYKGARYGGQVRAFDAFVTALVEQGLTPPSSTTWVADGSQVTLRDELTIDPPISGIRKKVCARRMMSEDRPAISEVRIGKSVIRSARAEGYKLVRASQGNPRKLPTEALYDVFAKSGETRVKDETDGPCGAPRRYKRELARLLDRGTRADSGSNSGDSKSEDGKGKERGRWLRNLFRGRKKG